MRTSLPAAGGVALLLASAFSWSCQPAGSASDPGVSRSALTTTTLTLDQSQAGAPLDLSPYSLGQGGLSSLPMLHEHVDQISALHPKTIRLFLQEYYGIYPAHGTYDWTKLDATLDDIVATGAEPIANITFKPAVLYPTIDPTITDPNSYPEWQELISALVTHCLEKGYGIHYWEIGNEGDIGEPGGCPYQFTGEGYVRWYASTAAAVLAADPTAKVGGPAEAGFGSALSSALIAAAANGTVPMHFWSWHDYTNDASSFQSTIQSAHATLAQHPSLANVETMISEWNMAGLSSESPAFIAQVTRMFHQEGLSSSAFYHLRDWHASEAEFAQFMTPSGAHNMASYWAGDPYFGIFDVHGTPRATYHAFAWLSALAGAEVPVGGTSADVNAMAVRNGNTMNALIWNFSATNSYTVDLSLPSTSSGYVELWRIDQSTQGVDVVAHVPVSSLAASPISVTLSPYDVYWLETRPVSFSADALAFSAPQNGSAAAQSTTLSYDGPNPTLPFTATSSAPWLQVSTASGSGDGQVLTNTVDPSSLSPGSYHATVTVSRSDLDATRYEVDLQVQDPVVPGTIFTTQTPAITDASDGQPLELGMKFQSSDAGQVTALRYYKSSAETGAHTASLWSASGTLLATATFANEGFAGWQQASLTTPVSILPSTTYVVSVGINSDYVATNEGLAQSVARGSLSTVADGQNGVFGTKGAFPNQSFESTNYFTDLIFVPSPPTGGSTGSTLFTTQVPAIGNQTDNVSYELGTKLQSSASGQISAIRYYRAPGETGSHTGHLWSSDGTLLGSATFSGESASGWQQAALDTPVAITTGTTYIASIGINAYYVATSNGLATQVTNGPLSSVADGQNGVFATTEGAFPNQSFQSTSYFVDVVFAPSAATTLFTTQVPAIGNQTDNVSYELGTKLQSSASGQISAIRYYRAPGETGSHTGHLWSSDGTLLGSATFSGESASGWQQAALDTPVAITAGTTYIASIGINAYYVATNNGLATQVTNGPLSSVADGQNGVFATTEGAFPNQSFQSTSYFVDVAFTP